MHNFRPRSRRICRYKVPRHRRVRRKALCKDAHDAQTHVRQARQILRISPFAPSGPRRIRTRRSKSHADISSLRNARAAHTPRPRKDGCARLRPGREGAYRPRHLPEGDAGHARNGGRGDVSCRRERHGNHPLQLQFQGQAHPVCARGAEALRSARRLHALIQKGQGGRKLEAGARIFGQNIVCVVHFPRQKAVRKFCARPRRVRGNKVPRHGYVEGQKVQPHADDAQAHFRAQSALCRISVHPPDGEGGRSPRQAAGGTHAVRI